MDIEKLFSILNDLKREEEDNKLQDQLNSFQSNINNAEEADRLRDEIFQICEKSSFNDYSISLLKILKKIGAYEFVGLGAIQFLKKTFRVDTYKVAGVLEGYVQKRQTFFSNIDKYISILEELNFQPYYEDLELTEIGLLLPEDVKNIENIEDYLHKLNFILRGVSEIATGKSTPVKISSISKGSLEFFTQSPLETATCLVLLFRGVLGIYEKILQIRKLKEDAKKLKFEEFTKEMKEREKEIIEEEKEKIVKNIFTKFKKSKKDSTRDKELKVHLRKSIDYLIKMRDQGTIIETTPPKVEKPEILDEDETEENKKERRSKEKEYLSKLKPVKNLLEIFNSTKELLQSTKKILQIGHSIKDDEEDKE